MHVAQKANYYQSLTPKMGWDFGALCRFKSEIRNPKFEMSVIPNSAICIR